MKKRITILLLTLLFLIGCSPEPPAAGSGDELPVPELPVPVDPGYHGVRTDTVGFWEDTPVFYRSGYRSSDTRTTWVGSLQSMDGILEIAVPAETAVYSPDRGGFLCCRQMWSGGAMLELHLPDRTVTELWPVPGDAVLRLVREDIFLFQTAEGWFRLDLTTGETDPLPEQTGDMELLCADRERVFLWAEEIPGTRSVWYCDLRTLVCSAVFQRQAVILPRILPETITDGTVRALDPASRTLFCYGADGSGPVPGLTLEMPGTQEQEPDLALAWAGSELIMAVREGAEDKVRVWRARGTDWQALAAESISLAPVIRSGLDLCLAAREDRWILTRSGGRAVMAGTLSTGDLDLFWLE